MPSSPTLLFLLISLLLAVKGEDDAFARVVPKIQARLNEVRKILLPMPEDQLKEVIYHLGTYYIPLDSESEICRNHSSILFESYLNYDLWALKMVDAASKIPAGVIDARLMDLGNFDQCLSVEAPGGLFRGQHCIVETKGILPDMDNFNPERPFLPMMRVDIVFSVCVPSSCSPEDVKTHMNVALNSINATAILSEYNCTTSFSEPFSFMEWVVILLLVLIVGLLVASTMYDKGSKDSEKNEVLSSFSLTANISRMLNTYSPAAAITCLNGLRVLAMFWIILGHRTLYMLSFPSTRIKTIAERIDEFALAPIENTQVAVEIFFLMSGILVSYSFLRYRLKSKTFNLLHFYLFRYVRLTPPYAMMILLYSTLLIRATDGPLWRLNFGYLRDFCVKHWWTNLLYIHNYVTPYELCITQTWYLSSDFQLYFFSPLVLIPLHKRPRLGLALTGTLLVLTTAGGLVNAAVEQLKAGGAVTFDRRTEINQVKDYIVTHFRAASFLMGIALGYLLFRIKQEKLIIKLSKYTLWAGWLLALFFMLFSVFFVLWFQDPDYVYTPVVDTLYLVLHRHIFSAGVMWIILVCTLGYGGMLNEFLSWPVFTPLARLTYCAYLTHVFMQNTQSSSQRGEIHLSLTQLYYLSLADVFASYLAAAVLYLTIEAPFTNLTNYFFQGRRKKSEDTVEVGNEISVFKYTAS